MWSLGKGFDETFGLVKAARGVASPNIGFTCQVGAGAAAGAGDAAVGAASGAVMHTAQPGAAPAAGNVAHAVGTRPHSS